jgi:hypothetical protein
LRFFLAFSQAASAVHFGIGFGAFRAAKFLLKTCLGLPFASPVVAMNYYLGETEG